LKGDGAVIAASEKIQSPSKSGHGALYAGGIAAILASTCHHISFLLVILGLSSTRIVYIVTLADRARPFLITVALIALFVSYLRIWHISSAYKAGRNSTNSQTKVTDKVFFLFIALLVITVLMLPYFLPCTE
jgi:mercuric ion transport protein